MKYSKSGFIQFKSLLHVSARQSNNAKFSQTKNIKPINRFERYCSDIFGEGCFDHEARGICQVSRLCCFLQLKYLYHAYFTDSGHKLVKRLLLDYADVRNDYESALQSENWDNWQLNIESEAEDLEHVVPQKRIKKDMNTSCVFFIR